MAEQMHTGRPMARFVYTFAAAVVGCFVAAILYVLVFASGVASDIRHDVEHSLVRNEFANQMRQLAHDQSQISHWDEMVRAVKSESAEELLRSKVAGWIWKDFGVQYTIVVGPELRTKAVLFKREVMDAAHGDETIAQHHDLIERAQQNYLSQSVVSSEGHRAESHPVRSQTPIDVRAIRQVAGKPGIVAVQAIVPHENEYLVDRLPHTMVTFKPFASQKVEAIGDRRGVADLKLVPQSSAVGGDIWSVVELEDANQELAFQLVWKSVSPWNTILSGTLGVVIAMLAAASLAMLFISRRHRLALLSLEQINESYLFMALHDVLTGLPNRAQFDAKLDKVMADGTAKQYSVLCIDLDHFKAVNDTHGHSAGDAVLLVAAQRMSAAVQSDGMVARVGGDEFIVLLWDNTDRSSVHWLAESIIESICQEIAFEGGTAFIGASIGVAFAPDDAQSAKQLLQLADGALYQAKKAGRNRTCFFEEVAASRNALCPAVA